MKTVQEWTDYRLAAADWPLAHFSPKELASGGSSAKPDMLLKVHWRSALALDELRQRLGHALHLNSAYRSPAHNTAVRGAAGSQHLEGRAYDVNRSTIRDEVRFLVQAWNLGFRGFGFYDGFIHIDTGRKRTWDDRSDKSQPHPIPWELRGAFDDGEVPADIRAIPAPPRPPRSADRGTPVAAGATGAGAVVVVAQQALEQVNEAAASFPFLLVVGVAVIAGAAGVLWWRWRQDRRERDA